jgi:hypothetical protein
MNHAPQNQPSSSNSALKKVAIVMAGLFAACMLACCLGLMWLGSGPQNGVLLPNQMEPYAAEYIEKHDLMDDDEKLRAYFDVTIDLDATESYILTDRRVIHHRNGTTSEIALADIEDISVSEDIVGSTVIDITSTYGDQMKLEIAPLNGGETFLNALRQARKHAQAK